MTVEAKKVGARVATVKVGIGTGQYTYAVQLRIKEVRPRMRPRRSANCVELLKKFLNVWVHRERADYFHSTSVQRSASSSCACG